MHKSVDLGAYEYQGAFPDVLAGFYNDDNTTIGPGEFTVLSPWLAVLDGKKLQIAPGTILRFPSWSLMDVYGSFTVNGQYG